MKWREFTKVEVDLLGSQQSEEAGIFDRDHACSCFRPGTLTLISDTVGRSHPPTPPSSMNFELKRVFDIKRNLRKATSKLSCCLWYISPKL